MWIQYKINDEQSRYLRRYQFTTFYASLSMDLKNLFYSFLLFFIKLTKNNLKRKAIPNLFLAHNKY